MTRLTVTAFSLAIMTAPGAHATLHDRGPDMFYDDAIGVTYLRTSAAGSAFDDGTSSTDGLLSYGNATGWAEALAVKNERGALITDWRLPSRTEPVYGSGGGIFGWYADRYTGAVPSNSVLTVEGWLVREPGSNWPPSLVYAYPTSPGGSFGLAVDTLDMGNGSQYRMYGGAWAVRTGDVALVPEPATWALMTIGLGLAGARRRWRPRCYSR